MKCLIKIKTLLLILLLISIPYYAIAANSKFFLNINKIDLSEYSNNAKINLHCTIEDTTGNRVKNLTKDNFTLKLLNLRREYDILDFNIENILPTDEPLYIVLLFDSSQSMLKNNALLEAKKAALNFIENLRDIDKVMIISFSDNVEIKENFNNNKEKLKEVVNSINTGEYTKLYDAINLALDRIKDVLSNRKVIILLSDGKDSRDEGYKIGSNSKIEDVLRRCETYKIPVYTIGLGDADQNTLERISMLSKGLSLYTSEPNQLKDLYNKISESLKDTYKISFIDPEPARKMDLRKVIIRVNFDGNYANSEKAFIVNEIEKKNKNYLFLTSILYLTILVILIVIAISIILYRKKIKSSIYHKDKEKIKVESDKKVK